MSEEPVSEGGWATDDDRAASVFEATLQPATGGRLLRGARVVAAFAAELAMGLLPAPSVSDVVVTRRRDGREVLRVPAGDPNVPGTMLGLMRSQLDELTAAEFMEEWGVREGA